MTTNRITFVAELKDRFTGPIGNATDAVKRFEQAASKAGTAAEKTSTSFEHVRNSAGKIVTGMSEADRALGRHYDNMGRVQEANGRWAKGAQKAAWANDELALAAARVDKASDKQRNTMSKLGTILGKVDSGMAAAAGNGSTKLERAFGKVQGGTSRLSKALNNVNPDSAVSRFGRGMSRMAEHANTAASKIESAMTRAGKAIGLAGAGLATASLVGGGNRLMALESADVKLDVMGYDEGARQGIMGTVDEAVTGTPFALNEAATAATQYLAAGVTEQDLGAKLGTTVDLAAIYDMELGDASGILSKVLATGTLQGDEAAQLMERGMPIYSTLAESMGVEQSEVKGMISEGKVSAEDLFAALSPSVEGGAARLGDTFKGVFANLRTAFSRTGALFLEPLMDPLKDLMRNVTQSLKDAAPFFTELGARIAPGIAAAAEHAPKLAAALEPLGGPILAAAGSFADLLPSIVQGLTLWAMVLGLVLPPLLNLISFVADLTGPFLPILIPLLFAAGTAFSAWRVISTITPMIGGLSKVLGVLSRVILAHPILWIPLAVYAVAKAFGWLYDNVEPVREAFDKVSDVASGIVKFFLDIGDAIDSLVEEKFPKLHEAMQLDAGPIGGISKALNGVAEEKGGGVRSFLGTGEHWGSGEGLLRFMHGSGAGEDEDLPHHADGGFTASGAHKAVLGEEGREFIVDHWATEKLASIPGAIPAISKGKLPVQSVPVPFGINSGQATAGGDTFILNINGITDPHAVGVVVRSELDKRDRTKRLTNSTLTARGAR